MPWLCRQSDPVSCLCVHWEVRSITTREKIPLSRQLLKIGTRWPETCWATYKEQLIRRNKYNTKWHLVGFLFHIELWCTVNYTSNVLSCLSMTMQCTCRVGSCPVVCGRSWPVFDPAVQYFLTYGGGWVSHRSFFAPACNRTTIPWTYNP